MYEVSDKSLTRVEVMQYLEAGEWIHKITLSGKYVMLINGEIFKVGPKIARSLDLEYVYSNDPSLTIAYKLRA